MTCAAERWYEVKGFFSFNPSNLSHRNPEIESSGSWHNWQRKITTYIYIYIFTHTYIYTVYHKFISTTKQFCAASLLFSLRQNRWPEIWRMTYSLIPFRPMTQFHQVSRSNPQAQRAVVHPSLLEAFDRSANPKLGWVLDELLYSLKRMIFKKHQAIRIQTSGKPIFIFHVPKEAREREWQSSSWVMGFNPVEK